MHHDTIDETVGRFAPTAASTAAQWSTDQQDSVLAAIIGERSATGDLEVVHELLTTVPPARTRRHRALLPLAASIAVLAAAAGTLLAVLPGGSGSDSVGSLPAGEPFDPPAGLSAAALPAGAWAYSVSQQNEIGPQGQIVSGGRDASTIRSWTSDRGDVYVVRTGQQDGCNYRPNHSPSKDAPDGAFFRSLPTDPDKLLTYLRRQANGSSSRDEAVFVSVGDMLGAADGLASPKLRAAFVAALSRTPGVLLHRNTLDQLGRPALRLDFVDQQIRPGDVQSLYFSPTNFRLLEQREGTNGAPNRYNGPSPAYTHAARTGRDPQILSGPGFAETYSGQQVVKSVPASVRRCRTSSGQGG